MSPYVTRILRYFLIGLGAITLISAVVNILGAVQLLTAVEEDALGFTRREFILWFIGPGLLGLAMIILGIFWRRKP